MRAKPTWFLNVEPETATEYAGTTLGDYYTNPDVTLETERASRKAFYDTFGYGSPEMDVMSLAPLFYSCASVLGLRIVFPADDSPQVRGRLIEDLADVGRLRVVQDVAAAGYVPQLIEQYEYLTRKSNVTGVRPVFSLPGQSPLGTAIVLRGSELFADVVTHPTEVKALLEIITETAIRVFRFQEQFTGEPLESIGMDDDYGGLVSAEIYAEFNYPYMRRIYEAFETKTRHLHSETHGKEHLPFVRKLGITNYDIWPYDSITVGDVLRELSDTFFTWNPATPKALLSDTPEQVKGRYRDAVAAGAPGFQLTLCARRVPPDNIRAFVEVGRELGGQESN